MRTLWRVVNERIMDSADWQSWNPWLSTDRHKYRICWWCYAGSMTRTWVKLTDENVMYKVGWWGRWRGYVGNNSTIYSTCGVRDNTTIGVTSEILSVVTPGNREVCVIGHCVIVSFYSSQDMIKDQAERKAMFSCCVILSMQPISKANLTAFVTNSIHWCEKENDLDPSLCRTNTVASHIPFTNQCSQRFQKLIHLNLFTNYFMQISPQSSAQAQFKISVLWIISLSYNYPCINP